MGGSYSTYGESRGLFRDCGGKPEGKRPLGRHRHRWEDNTKMYSHEVGGGDIQRIELD